MKNQFLPMLLSPAFLIVQRLFAPAFSVKTGVRSGTVTANLAASSDDLLAAEATGAEVPRGTLGACVASAIEAARATGRKLIRVTGVNGTVRTIEVHPVEAGFQTIRGAAAELIILTRQMLADETEPSKVAPWSAEPRAGVFDENNPAHVALLAAVNAILAPQVPRFSIASLIGKLEDIEGAAVESFVVDQTGAGTLNICPAGGGSNVAPEATIMQDVTPGDSGATAKLPFE